MTLTVYNTLTRSKSVFQTIQENQVRMYCCGITVYDYCHLGHARTCLIWDVVRRYLEWSGYKVNYIQNFTDIDDKILNRARQEGTSMEAVSEKYIAAYFEDMERLGVGKADAYPRATHTLDGIKRLVSELEQKGFAYPAEGDVYYSVQKFPEYGKLSGRKLEDMQAGASGRVDAEDPEANKKRASTADGVPSAGDWRKKQYPFDFALWKAAKEDEPAWESPWGNGRPGWHIECSAMVRERLGETIDIHVGGGDLTFPHHENEIAQSEAVTGKPLANYWLHNGMIIVEGKKMSKSLGNFITIRELLEKYEPMVVRLFILQTQYRKPLDFTEEALNTAANSWQTLKAGLLFGDRYGEKLGFATSSDASSQDEASIGRFKDAVDDDFNFAGGLAILFEIAKNLEKEGNIIVHEGKNTTPTAELAQQWQTLIHLAAIFGFEAQLEKDDSTNGLSNAEIDALVQQRLDARKNKDYAQGDRIRNELQAQGITLIDKPGGVTIWNRG